ncbi:MAG: Lrp/AsnC family transcriptional regulator [Rhodospirillales bacterium]|jgi:Lrp/AsnC family transcriptional regulator|nr:Lrp/AsnC family transcriptional regulator [Rhodospirillales bacterium]
MKDLSDTDKRLLTLLQADATISQAVLAEKAGLSKTSCWRRIRDFEDAGIIERRATILDAKAMGFKLTVFVHVAMVEHSAETRDTFEAHIQDLAEVIACHSVSGTWDYLVQVVTRDIETFDAFHNREILQHPCVRSASSSFALRRIKSTTRLPL